MDRPLRGFDVNSLIGNTNDKDEDRENERTSPVSPHHSGGLGGGHSPLHKSSSGGHDMTPTYPSPNLSVGPPAPPAPPQSSLYPFLLHPGLYQHLASAGLAAGNPNMLLNAQLALMAQQNPMLASAYAQLNAAHAAQAAQVAQAQTAAASQQQLLSSSDRLRQSHRFSPYSFPPPPPSVGSTGSPASSPTAPGSTTGPTISSGGPTTTVNSGSAVHSIIPRNSSASSTSLLSNASPPPPASVALSSSNASNVTSSSNRLSAFQESSGGNGNATTHHQKGSSSRSPSPPSSITTACQKSPSAPHDKTTSSSAASSKPNASDIKSMENLVNGLNGSSSSKFGISHSDAGGSGGNAAAHGEIPT